MQLVRLALALITVAVALPATAVADGPIIDRYPGADDFVFDGCGFPVRVQLEGTYLDHLWFNEAGDLTRLIGNGPGFRVALTNVSTGASLRYSIPGALMTEQFADGSRSATTTGPWLLLYRPETLESGPPFTPWLFLHQGVRVLTVDAAGNRNVVFHGRFVDLCGELAG